MEDCLSYTLLRKYRRHKQSYVFRIQSFDLRLRHFGPKPEIHTVLQF